MSLHRCEFPCVLKNVLLAIRERSGLAFALKVLGYLVAPLLLLLLVYCYELPCYHR
eukprot:UN12588